MALLFSKVTMTGDGYETEFLVGGIPREYEDLEGWCAADDFLEDLKGWCAADDFLEDLENESDIQVHADAYIYGEGETVRATPEEIAYFMKRIDMNPDFLSNRCTNIESVDFNFNWDPVELFGMEEDYGGMYM